MNRNLKEIMDYIEDVRTEINNFIQASDETQLRMKPTSGAWSPAEILHHLYKTEIYITELLVRQLGRAKKRNMMAKQEGGSYLHSLDDLNIDTVKEKIKAPEIALPEENIEIKELFTKMNKSRAELRKVLQDFSEYDMEGIEFPHPTGKRMNMIQWILFLGKHELRHFKQIKSILRSS
ncbi:MAG: DinB family protein [Acidobacteriota bacterium]